ncbi:hypothetical protein V6N13_048403 [Hibiscus sabdariffa]
MTVEVTGGLSTLLVVYLQTDLECRVGFESGGLVLIWSLAVDWVAGRTSSVRWKIDGSICTEVTWEMNEFHHWNSEVHVGNVELEPGYGGTFALVGVQGVLYARL